MKEHKMRFWNKGYVENIHLVKCPSCGVWFTKPDWHYCRCPMCDHYLWDDRNG